MSAREIEARFDSAEFSRLIKGIRGFDKTLATQTRKRLRDAAMPAVADVKRELQAGGPSRTGLRAGLAAGTKVSIRTGRTGGVSIRTTSAKLPPGKAPMVKALEKQSFRHRVFGRNEWVVQSGLGYFRPVLNPHLTRMRDGMELALRDAVSAIEKGI